MLSHKNKNRERTVDRAQWERLIRTSVYNMYIIDMAHLPKAWNRD